MKNMPAIQAIKTGILISFALLITACATMGQIDNPAPDWVSASDEQYPRSIYMTGRGQANNISTAEDRARANIAKIFQVKIYERSTNLQKLEQTINSQGNTSTFNTRAQRFIRTETKQIIHGIEIAEVWRGPGNDNYYALAILSRQQAFKRIMKKTRQLDSSIANSLALSRNSSLSLNKAAHYTQALTTNIQRASLQKMAAIIDSKGTGISEKYPPHQLQKHLNQLLKQIKVHVSNTSSAENRTIAKTMMEAALSSAGISITNKDNSDYTLSGNIIITDIGQHDDWYWLRATTDIALTITATGKIVGQHTLKTVKSAGNNKISALQRVLEKVGLQLNSAMGDILISMVIPTTQHAGVNP